MIIYFKFLLERIIQKNYTINETRETKTKKKCFQNVVALYYKKKTFLSGKVNRFYMTIYDWVVSIDKYADIKVQCTHFKDNLYYFSICLD